MNLSGERFVPTRRAVVLLALLAPFALVGYWTIWGVDLLFGLNAVVMVMLFVDWRFATGGGKLRVVREGPESFSVGRPSEVRYHWSTRGSGNARLLVREIRPDVLGGAQPPRRVLIPGGGATREVIPVTPPRRGRETEGWFALRSVGPMGLAARQMRISLPWNVVVYPRLPASRLKASTAEAVRRRESGMRPLRRLGEGRQFESLREWIPGDDTRHIDWKATARRRKAVVREYEEERRQQVLLMLDTGRLLTAEIGGEARMEYMVRAALLLAFAAHHHDDNVGLMAFADDVQHYVAPQRGRRGLRQVLEVLAVLEPKLVEPDYPAAFRYLAIRNRKRALTVLFTDVIDRLASQALLANVGSLRPRHLPLVVTLRNPDLDDIATGRPSSIADAYRRAAAEELIAAREDALTQMRSGGAIVLDVAAEQASVAVVDAYQKLKRRGRL